MFLILKQWHIDLGDGSFGRVNVNGNDFSVVTIELNGLKMNFRGTTIDTQSFDDVLKNKNIEVQLFDNYFVN